MRKKQSKKVRLSEFVIPSHYKIHLTPDLENFTFMGTEEISIDIQKPSKKITLHSAEIEILSAEFIQKQKNFSAKVSYQDSEEAATLTLVSTVKGSGVLKLKFAGILNDKMRGFYRSRYEHAGKTYHMGVTQFESTDARRAFPCFDEPSQKAIFDLSLTVPSDRTVISNTIETEIAEHEGGFKTVKFAPSPKMSSYLLAFIVGHFEHIERKTKSGVLVRIYVTPGKKFQAEFALTAAVGCIEFYEDYFKIPYPLPTIDLVAIPDFAAGAMENWGAVTYRETALLVDPENTSAANKQWVALVIAHELAHQWFGNLVTMEWWTHLWLNEGFASYMEYVAVDHLFPKWKVWNQFVFIEHAKGLALDGLANTHPIEVKVQHPAEISEIFDAVSYSKGAAIIRMLAEFLGEEIFKKGLRAYLTKHKYGNASTGDLWKSLEKASGKPVGNIMKNWTGKAGYPLLSFESVGKSLKATQERFFSSGHIKNKDKVLWLTPFSIITESGSSPKFSLLEGKMLKIDSPKKGEWFKANFGETSFLRVKYSASNLKLLEKPISEKSGKLTESDRYGIIRDAFALCEAGQIPTSEVLKLALSYKKDDSFAVWLEIVAQILRLGSLLSGESYFEEFRAYSRGLLSEIIKKVAWEKIENETHEQTLLRSTALYAAGKSGDQSTIKRAQEIFTESKTSGKKIESDLRGVVYNLVAENGGKPEYQEFMHMYEKASLQEEKDRILRALCSFRDVGLLTQTLAFTFSKMVKDQDSFRGVALIFSNPIGRELVWNYLRDHWVDIVVRYSGGHLFVRFVSPLSDFKTYEKAQEVKDFFSKNPTAGVTRTVAQVVEQINSNAAWLARDSDKIKTFLASQSR